MSSTTDSKKSKATTKSLPAGFEHKSMKKAVDSSMKRLGLGMETSWFHRARRHRELAEAARIAGDGREA